MKKKVIWLTVTSLMTLALLAISCNPAPAAPAIPPAAPAAPASPAATETTPTSVTISGFIFSPATITIAEGTTVTWTNRDSVPHTVSNQGTPFESGRLSRSADFSYTFNQQGTFEYDCKIHPAMNGKIIVK